MQNHTVDPVKRARDIARGLAKKQLKKTAVFIPFDKTVKKIQEGVLREMYYRGEYHPPIKQ